MTDAVWLTMQSAKRKASLRAAIEEKMAKRRLVAANRSRSRRIKQKLQTSNCGCDNVDETTQPEEHVKLLDLQVTRSLEENLAEIPKACDVGCKKNSKGHVASWTGYKLHLTSADGDVPVAANLSSASVHDSQVIIPLTKLTDARVTYLYLLLDSAYDAKTARKFIRAHEHCPIIDRNKRRGVAIPKDPAETVRYRQRSSAERVNSNLKDNFGGRIVRVRGPAKVLCHLMFGVLALTATALFRLLS